MTLFTYLLDVTVMGLLSLLGGERIVIPSLPRDDDALAGHRLYIRDTVYPWYYDARVNGTFQGEKDATIYYESFPSPEPNNKAIIFLHGTPEQILKYAEYLYDTRRLDPGYDIWFMEHRGHGNSDRLLPKEPFLAYVDSSDNYAKDLKTFYDTVVTANKQYDKIILRGQSLGSATAVDFAEQYPNDVDGLILAAPMMEIATKTPLSLDESLGYCITCSSVTFGMGKMVALGQEVPTPLIDTASQDRFEQETGTTSWKRWRVWNEIIENNEQLISGGEGTTWGNTNQFAKELYDLSFKVRSAENAAKLVVPILLLQAEDDFIVNNRGHDTLRNNAVNVPSFQLVQLPKAYHTIHMEKDEIRDEALRLSSEFLRTFG